MTELGQGVPQLILVLVLYVVVIAAAVWLIAYLFPSPTHVRPDKPRQETDSRLRPSPATAERPNTSGESPEPAHQAAGKT